ncbi:MAG: hypothetical protein K2Y27_03860 [Xanthobacteraceae bacterium]|nr:hypothetical protein [Xanthobacteraceae bacterium]
MDGVLSAPDATSSFPRWSISTRGANWTSEATFELLDWNDLLSRDSQRTLAVRLARTAVTYLDLLFTGTLWRYLLANTRYFAFSVVPPLQAVALGVAATLIAAYAAAALMEATAIRCLVTAAAAIVLFVIFLKLAGPRWRMFQAFDDWILSLDYIRGTRRDLDDKIDRFAERIVTCARSEQPDEIIVVGHSLGATFAVDALARALDLDPALATRRAKLCLVTVGATIPKCALHPAADRLRERIAKVVAEPSVLWAEYQAREDAISFYRFDPASLTRIGGKADRLDSRPIIRRINVKNLLSPEIYKRFRLRVLRLHYQFVSANDIRAVYDYFMMICGPVLATAWTTSRLGFLDFFPGPDSSAVEP